MSCKKVVVFDSKLQFHDTDKGDKGCTGRPKFLQL